MKFVSQMTELELSTLNSLRKYGPCNRIRDRAHILLLNHDSYEINKIALILKIDRDMISRTIDRWEKRGLGGLYDLKRSGRPPKLTQPIKKKWRKKSRNIHVH